MLTLVLARLLPRTLIAAAVLVAVSAPADAKVVYRWKTDDGVQAFTDDAKRIPEKYRSQAKASQLRSLHGYKRYTPAQVSGTKAHAKRMEDSAAEMARLNARLSGRSVISSSRAAAGARSPGDAELLVGPNGATGLRIEAGSVDGYSGEPLVIEEKRAYVRGLNSTRTRTIVRQGDRILAVTEPLPHENDLGEIPTEEGLPD